KIDYLSGTGEAVPLVKRDHNRKRAEQARYQIAKRVPRRHRRSIRFADQMRQPTHRLGDPVKPRSVLIRPGLPETGDAQQNRLRLDGFNDAVAETPFLQRAGPIVLDDHIATANQVLEDGRTRRLAEIECDASFVATDRFPP